MARLNARPGRLRGRARKWDRFSKWAPGAAILALVVLLALLAAAVLTAIYPGDRQAAQPAAVTAAAVQPDSAAPGNPDLQLYQRVAERVGDGEGYYRVAVEEHRERGMPLRPGLSVRLPTLALVSGALGPWGMGALALALVLLILAAWWRKLADEPGGREYRTWVLLLLLLGMTPMLRADYLLLHEAWAGMLIALSFGLHRPGKWLSALLVAALALTVRELALPFAVLMGVLALGRGHRREALAWGALVVLFGIGLLVHLVQVAVASTPDDMIAPAWLAMRGFGGWTGNLVESSALTLLPVWLAAPIAVLPLLGWAGWRSDTGLTGFLLCAGYGLAFTLAGRDSNFTWALVVLPVWFIGLAFVPRALASLWSSARDY